MDRVRKCIEEIYAAAYLVDDAKLKNKSKKQPLIELVRAMEKMEALKQKIVDQIRNTGDK